MSAEAVNKMQYVRLGKSGLKVSKIILGCMSYGVKRPKDNWTWVLEEEEALKHLKHAYDRGINTFDTADTYSQGNSERILGKFLKTYDIPRESVVIMTKTYMAWGDEKSYGPAGYVNNSRLSRKRIFAAIQGSLERLGTDYVDVFQCHRFDYETPIEETMQALHDVVQAGHVRYLGMSSCYAWQFQLMQQYAIHNKLTPFISMQNYHNAMYREEEREMMPTLQHFGVGSIPWSPLAGGKLCRALNTENETERSQSTARMYGDLSDADQATINTIEEIAKTRGISMAQVALAWSLSKSFISAPIIGTTSLEKLDDLLKGLEVTLTDEEIKSIDGLYKPKAILGHS
ncbi:uncharacterized protein I303_102819 [Kwoniella dejecticola CBS 10117]|uniref:Aryl-alcohol dehydrogenase n=1 Tax=Kwoniella dejecticola CBS 10117 TaxID=1296121 RepID=A0A1A6A9T8_9TREE|nr:aryl-alcohol dehydrogenase [Kwoniella dejecticola CBS 10117]OBR86818.1 aryl-alcohol dehydrogenase [Kwoniella dejecticola CBS 10117]